MLSSKTFDPYHKWLGIRPEEQPANYYRLLGIALFEDDADAIAGAADQRMAHVRSFQTGNYAALSQRILNEIAVARVCLLTPQKKAAYDQALKARFIPPSPPLAQTTESPVDNIPDMEYSSTYKQQHKKSTPSWMPWAFVGVGGLVVMIIFAVIAKSGRDEQAVAKTPAVVNVESQTSPTKKVEPNLDGKVVSKREPAKQNLVLSEPKIESQPVLESDSGDEIKPASESADLLCRIDVAANTVSGKWMMEEDGIATTSGKILMPVCVDGEYDLAVTFTRHSGNDTVAVMLPVGLRRCGVILSGWNGQTSGIQLIDGKEAHSNPTARHPSILNNGQRHTLLIRVRKQDQLANIEVFLDKAAVASWQGNESSLDFGGEWQLPQIRRFALSTIQSTTFHSVQLKMISGKASWVDGGLLAKGKVEPKSAKPKLVVLEKDDPLPEVEAPKTKEPAKPQPEQPFKEKLPIPDDAAQEKVMATIRDIYKDDYKDRTALANKLFQRATETQDTTERFVLLYEAKSLASETWQGKLAFDVIDVMAKEYEISGPSLKVEVFEQAVKKPRISPEQKIAIAKAALEVVDAAIGEDKFDVAKKAGRIASQLVRQTNNKDLLQEIVAKGKDVGTAAKAYADAQKAMATLKGMPDNPEANLIVGKYLCFNKDNWEKGLPMLAKGSDDTFKALATKDIAGAANANEQVKLGDAWWDVANMQEGMAKKRIEDRTGDWYRQALPNLSGLTKDKVEKRINKIQVGKDSIVDLFLYTQGKVGKGGLVLGPSSTPSTVAISYKPSGEYDLILVFTTNRVQSFYDFIVNVPFAEKIFCFCVRWSQGQDQLGFFKSDRRLEATVLPSNLKPGTKYTLLLEMRKLGVKAYLDGKLVCDTEYSSLHGRAGNELSFVTSPGGNQTVIHQASVRKVSSETTADSRCPVELKASRTLKTEYLADLTPVSFQILSGLEPRTQHDYSGQSATVLGQKVLHRLIAHPPDGGRPARIVFDIKGQYRKLAGSIGICDNNNPRTAVVFRIEGDGRPLWKSQSLQKTGVTEAFNVHVERVNRLELIVDCPGDRTDCWAVWIDPVLTRR